MALEKRKGLAEKVAARKAASGQAGTVKRAAEEVARKAATGQAGKDKVWRLHFVSEKIGCSGYGA